MRTEPTQIPSYDELCKIVSFEEFREVPIEKKYTHYTDFSYIINLLKELRLSTKFFDSNFQFVDFKDPILFNEVNSMFIDLVNNILKTQDDPKTRLLYDKIYDYLSESDQIQKADIIFVFGSKTTFRTQTAINLYKNGYAPKILISGKCPFYEMDIQKVSEAQKLANFASENGVPESALILEKESITIPDNIKRSLNMLENKNISHNSIILVNSNFSQRIGWAHFSKFSKYNTKIIRFNVDILSEQYSRNEWYKNEIGTKTIIKELIALKMSEILNTS